MIRNFNSYEEWKKAQEEKEKSITDSVKEGGMGTDPSSGQQRTFRSYSEWKKVNRPEEYQKEQATLLKEQIEKPRKEYEAKVQEFDTQLGQAKEERNILQKIFRSPTKKEKELAGQKAEFVATTYNKRYTQEEKDAILAQKPKDVKLSDEQYISLRADVDNQLKYLNSVKAITTQAEESLNNFQQWEVKQTFDGKETIRKVPFLPTKELVAQSNTYNTQTDWTQAYDYLKKAAKESGMSEEEYAKSYNAQISGQMLDIYKKVVGDVSLTKDDIISTTRRTGIPAVDDNQIRIEIENINQYLDKAKGIYDEYTGVKEVDKVDNIKEGLEVARDKILGGTAPFVGDLFNSNQEGFLDIAQLKQLEQKLANGEKLTTAETARIVLTSALETNQQIDRGWKTRVAQGTPEALKMMGEMAATYGMFNAAQTAVKTTAVAATRKISYSAAKEIVEAAASETGKTWIRTLATKGAKEGLKQVMGGVAVAMIAEIPETIAKDSLKIATEVMNNNRPVISFSDPETEEEFISIVKNDEEYESDWVNDLTKAFARQYFNNILERGAGEVPDAIIAEGADKLKGLVIAKYMSQKGIQTLEEFQKVYDAIGLQGIFGEVFEEYAQDYTESIIDNRDFIIDDPDKFWDIVAQVGVLQLGRAGSVATTAIDVTSNLITGKTFETDQQVPAVEGEAPVDTRTGQDLDTLVTNTQAGESIQDDLQTKEILRQQQVSGGTQTVLTEPVDDATLLSKAQALSDISKQTDYSLSSLTELKKLEKQATDEKTAQAIATISSSYADVLAKKVADGSVNIGQQIDTQLQDNIKEISPDETVQEGIKTTKQQILETPNKEYFVQEKGKFKEIKNAQTVKIINEADTFIYKDAESKLYQVVEAKSGMAIAEASTRSTAIEQATAKLNKMGVETFQNKVQEVINKKGISPRYIKKEAKKAKSTKKAKKSIETRKEKTVESVAQEAKRIQEEAIEDQTRGLIEDAKRLNKEDFIEQFGYLFEGDELSPYTETAEEFYDNATGEKSPIEKAGLKIGSKIKVQGKLREVSEFGKSARDSQGVLVRFTDGTYITLDKAQEYAAQKQTKDAIKKESTQKTKEAIKEAEETVRKLEKEKKVDQNQLAKRRMDIGKTNPEVRRITKDLKDFKESEDYIALDKEYKILLKEARLTHSKLESYIDNMIDMYGEEAATYLDDFMQRWTAAQAAIQTLTDSKSEIINNQLREEGFNLPKYRTYRPADQRNLVVIRNMSREAVKMAIDNGGMPVPSVAITKYDIPFVDFGEISFIGAADMVDPESGEVKVLTSDAWTPTVPEKEYKVSDYRKVLTDAEIKFLEKFDVIRWLDLESTSEHERKNAVITVDQMEEGKDKVRARELVDKVMGEPFVTLKNPKPQGLLGRAIKENAAIRKIWKESRSFYDFNLLYENEAETIDIMDAYAKELYPEDGDDAFYNPEFEKQLSLEYEIQKPYNNSEALAEKIMQDIDLYSEGDVRSNKGFSPLRAKLAREFTSIQDIIDQSDRLKAKPTEEEAKNMDMKTKTDFIFDAIQSLPEADQKYFMDWNRDFTKWERLDGVLAGWKKITKAKLTEFLFNESGGYMRDDKLGRVTYQKPSMELVKKFVSNIDIKQMDEYYENEYRNPETDMFEAKILRNVLLEEWKGAVVPNDIDPQLKKAIKDAGGRMFKLYEYDPAKPETRQEAIENFKDYRFRFETEHERITGERASQETIDKIMKMNKKFFGDENVRVVESLMSEDGRKVSGRYLAGWADLLNDKEELEPTYYHEAGHKGLELIGQTDPKRVEKILDEVIETKGITYLQIRWGNYTSDTIAKYLYETARRQGIRRYDDIVSMKDIERNLAILRYDQRVRREFESLQKNGQKILLSEQEYKELNYLDKRDYDNHILPKLKKIEKRGLKPDEVVIIKTGDGKWTDTDIKVALNRGVYRTTTVGVAKYKDLESTGNELKDSRGERFLINDLVARYRGATNEDNAYIWAEEELVENFIDYVQGRQTFTGQIKQFFDDLLEFIKSLVGAESQVKKLYREIYTGKLSTKQMDNIQKQYVPKYRADLLFDEEVEVETLLPSDRPAGEKTLADLKYTGNKANIGKTKVSMLEGVIAEAKSVADKGGDGRVGNYEVYDVLKKIKNGRLTVYHGTSEEGAKAIGGGWGGLKDGSYLSLTKGAEKEALGVYGAKYYADIADKYGKNGEVLKFEIPLRNLAIDTTTGELRYISDRSKTQKEQKIKPKYRADLLFDEEVEVKEKKPKKETTLEITKTPEAGVVYDVKGSSILPSRKLQQQIEETLMSGQSTPATRSVTAFMPVIETTGKIKDSRAFEKIQDRYAEIQELDPSLNELKYKSMSIADITAKAMAFVDEYPAEARRVALGMELAPEGTTNIAVSLAYTEKMFEEGKWKQAREADRALSLRGTRLGQEIVSFKGRLNANSPMFFMEQVLNARRMVVSSRIFKSGSLENFAKMKQERMAEVAKTLKQIKLEKAEDFINKLIC